MRKNVLVLVAFLVLSCLGLAQNNVIQPELQTILNQKTNDYIDINILFKSQMSSDYLSSINCKSDNREVRREIVTNELKKFSEQSQKDVLDFLNAEAKNNNVTDINAHWLVNSINCKATRDVIYQLASHPDIEMIGYDEKEIVANDNDTQDYSATRESQTVSQHISHINADKVWKLGYTGKGVVVAIIDTGVNYDHVDLKDHLWKDGSNTYPGYNFLNPGTAPSDDKGHGTHCAGVVGGDGTSGTATGIAPDATLMCLKVNSASVNAQLSTIVTAVEYAVDKGADVISISKNGWANNDAHITFRNLFNNTLEAGIITVVSAGNYRANLNTNLPVPGNVMAPANCPPPYLHPDQTLTGGLSGVMCIGSVGYDNQIAAFSSQGPVTWEGVSGYNDYPYNNGASMGLIRPDVVAPGENIFTLSNTENNGLVETMGTSISTPITAGVIALMLEKNPDLTPAEICRILENTATKLTEKKSNDYGSGCVDALAAVQNTEFNTSNAAVNLYSFDETINAKQNTNFSITIINNGKGTGSGNVTISTTNGNISFTNTTASYSGLAAGQTTTLNFTANVNTNATDQETATFTLNIDGISKDVEVIISNELVPPTNITSNVQGTNIALSWDEANNATSYNIYRDGTYIANTTSTSYTDEGLNYGTLYTYNITTKRNSLESEKSIDVRVQTLDNPEAPSPTNVAAINNGSSVNLTWTNSTGSLSSNVYKMNSGIETKIASNVNGTSYTDNTALGTGIYKYGVSNVHAKNETIYEEDFENSGEGWYRYYSNNNFKINWSFAKSATFGDFGAYMGNMSAFISNTANNENYLSYLVSPQFDLTEHDGSTTKLSFYYITPSWAGDINTLKVKVSTSSNQGPWTELWSSNKKDISTWTKAEIDLSAYTNSTFYIAFENTIGAGYCTGVDNVNISVEGEKESRIEWSEDIYNNINVFVQDGDWSNTSNWGAKRLPNESEQVVIDANATINSGSYTLNSLTINEGKSLTLNSDVKLTVTGDFVNTNPDAFIINDGAQVIQNNDDVAATFNMNISNPSEWSAENIEGWQFISSPVKGAEISDFVPEYSDYDLYIYDGSNNLEWINHKDENEEEPLQLTTVEIGEDQNPNSTNNYYLPTYDYYSGYYSMTQQIYTEDEIGVVGDIHKISFKVASGNTTTRDLEVYVNHTNLNSFSGNTVALSESDKVFDGTVEIGAEDSWFTIVFDEPFTYEGGNLLICVNSKTTTEGKHLFYKYPVSSYRGCYQTSDNAELDVTQTYEIGVYNYFQYVNQIKLDMELGAMPEIPSAPIVEAVANGATSITLSWNAVAGATKYKVYDGEGNFIAETTESSYTIEGLTAGTQHCFSVSAVNIGGESAKTKACAETEDAPLNPTTFSYDFNDQDISKFTLIDEDGDGKNWVIKTPHQNVNLAMTSYSSSNETGSWVAYRPINIFHTKDKYLITSSSKLSYDVLTTNYSETYAVIISEDGINFTEIKKDTYNAGWNYNVEHVDLDLKDYEGQLLYIGFKHFESYDQYFIAIDNFKLTDGSTKSRNGKSSSQSELPEMLRSKTFDWTTFQQGVGYMASYEIETTATFKGILNHENSYTFNLSYDNTKDLANLHLLGNPFSFDIDWNDLVKTNIVDGFAVVNENGSYDYHSSGTIKVGDGIFVKTIGDNPSISYGLSKGQRDREVDAESINLVATSSIGSDNVIISLSGSENEGFTKLQNFNEAIANIFVTKNDVRYAIAKFDKDVTTIDVAFEAKEMGNYTIAAQPQGKFETLTLVDRITGIETDLLVENYNFTATSKDDLNRFIVKLEVDSQEPTVNGNFAYVSGEELIIKAEGIVQIFDLMGRVVYSNEVTSDNNRINVGDFNNAVYIIRCVNDESVKTQKVVIN